MADKKPEKKFEKKFDKKPVEAKPGISGAEIIVVAVLAIIVLPLLGIFFSPEFGSKLFAMFATPLAYVKMVATIISMIALAVIVYSFIRLQEIIGAEKEELGLALLWEHERIEKNERWERVEEYMRSLNPSDWKIAVLEADNILDDVVKRMGYQGETMGERMKMIEASDFPYLDDAWRAHKTRNDIEHQGGEHVLTRALAEQTINIYHRIFKELGYL